MRKLIATLSAGIFSLGILVYSRTVLTDSEQFGDQHNIAFAQELWKSMEGHKLVGNSSIPDTPYKGVHPHGTVLETLIDTLIVSGVEGEVLVKRNYGGSGVSLDSVNRNRKKFLKDVTVMFKREKGYDEDNLNWFWAKYDPSGKLSANPRGIKLAGRVAKGKSKGCIACHRRAPGDDYLYVK